MQLSSKSDSRPLPAQQAESAQEQTSKLVFGVKPQPKRKALPLAGVDEQGRELIHCWKCDSIGVRYPGKGICRGCRREQDRNKPSVVKRRRYAKRGRPRKDAAPLTTQLNNHWLTRALI